MSAIGLAMSDVIIAGGALVVMVMFMLWGQSQKQAKLRRRIARMKQRKYSAPRSSALDVLSLRRKNDQKLPPLVELLLKPLPNFETLGHKLQRAGSFMDARQYILRCLLGMFIIAFVLQMMGRSFTFGLCAGFIVALWLPLKILNMKINGQHKKFLKLFPDAIDLIVRGLRSGLPVSESINLVMSEVPEPVAGIFTTIVNTMKLGVPMEKAMQDVAKKLSYTEFNFFVTSIILQRETGGNLSEILNNLAEVLRKRQMMKMKIHSMTSEARASSFIIGALPFFVSGLIFIISPGYIMVLVTDYRGNQALLTAFGLLSFGMWAMNRMAKFEI